MSVVLTNMELPQKGCSYCIEIFGDGSWCAIEEACYHGKAFDLPRNHGRLIDADDLVEKGVKMSWSVQKWVQEVDILLAPTIIPAEEE